MGAIGAVEEHPFLHFEVCPLSAIEFAIARGLPASRPAHKGSKACQGLSRGGDFFGVT
jgi:predicted N-acyltransferase